MNVCVSVAPWLLICSLCAFVKLSEANHCASVEGSSRLASAALTLTHPPASKSNKKYIRPESLSRDWNWQQLTITICFCFITRGHENLRIVQMISHRGGLSLLGEDTGEETDCIKRVSAENQHMHYYLLLLLGLLHCSQWLYMQSALIVPFTNDEILWLLRCWLALIPFLCQQLDEKINSALVSRIKIKCIQQ